MVGLAAFHKCEFYNLVGKYLPDELNMICGPVFTSSPSAWMMSTVRMMVLVPESLKLLDLKVSLEDVKEGTLRRDDYEQRRMLDLLVST